MESTASLSTWGSNALSKWGAQSDIVREGTNAMGLAPNSTGDTGMGYQHGSSVDLSANRLYVWIKIVSSSGFLTSAASYGCYIRITTSTSSWTTTYRDYIIGGNDIAWCNGDWHLVCLDANRTPSRTLGTPGALTAIRRIGVGFNLTATASKSDVIVVDVMRYGTKMEVTGVTSSSANHSFTSGTNTITRGAGSFTTDGFEAGDLIRIAGTASNDGEYTLATVGTTTMTTTGGITTEGSVASNIDGGVTLEDVYRKDGPTDGNWYGFVSKNRDGDFEINSNLLIGDESGSLRTFFASRGKTIIFADQPLSTSTAQLQIKTYQSTGNTIFALGQSTGTGDSRVGFSGSTVKQDNTYFGALSKVDLSVAVADCEVFGSQFQNITGGVLFANDTSHYLTNTVFAGCAQADIYAVEARNCEWSGYTGTTGALLWRDNVTDVLNCRFLSNTRSIQHTTASADQVYYSLQFAGNTYDINFSSATGNLSVSNNDSNASTYIYTGGGAGTVTILTSVTLTMNIQDKNNAAIGTAQCSIFRASDDLELMNTDSNGSGVATASYTSTTPAAVYWRVRKGSAGDTKYIKQSGAGTIQPISGFSVTVTLLVDPNNNS